MDTQVEKAINEGLTKFTSKYELDSSIVDDLRAMLMAAVKHVRPRTVASATLVKGEKKPRRKTGYNLYIRSMFEEVKGHTGGEDDPKSKPNSQEQMAEFSKRWKGLSEEERQPYIDQAEAINAENGAESGTSRTKRTGKRNLSGYNLFYREEKDNIRETKDKDTPLMVAVGAVWRALSADEHAAYNKRAAELSAEHEPEEEA